tara:strand:+ start:17934 stop:18371 length:438 start_codon:yes stop_codon:yes gene_type:complete
MRVYRYILEQNWSYQHKNFEGVSLQHQWFTIEKGTLTIHKNYAWDGCSPKMYILGVGTLGTPDGALRYGRPWTYHASLVHDVLCQFRYDLPFTKRQVIEVFYDQLHALRFPLRRLYVWVVKHFGPQDFAMATIERNPVVDKVAQK